MLGLTLAPGCLTRTVTLTNPECRVPEWPVVPMVTFYTPCPDAAVCLTIPTAEEITNWVKDVERIHDDLGTCDIHWGPRGIDGGQGATP